MRILLPLIFLFSLHASAQQARKRPKNYPPTIPGATAEVYKQVGDVELKLYVVRPENHKASDRRPAIVFFFGGGWKSGSPQQFAPHCADFAAKGLVAITADYRVATRHGVKAVSCVEDAKSAIRWVRRNAAQLGIDPQRIVAAGGSAGGHLAAATGTVTKFDHPNEQADISSVPNAMILYNPACVLAPISDKHAEWNKNAKDLKERAGVEPREISPYHHVKKGTPPALIFHGRADTTVPYLTAEMFAKAMKKQESRCELVGFDDMPHGFFNKGKFNDKPYRETMVKAEAFLGSLGYLGGVK